MKTLLYDIETSPNLAWVWGKFEQNVIEFEEEWYLLCFAYKWLGEKKTHVVALPDFSEYKKAPTNDIEVVRALYNLFNEADVVVAHNGDRFDQKKSHARFIYHGMPPPEPYQSVDTCKLARKYFAFNSNKLDDLGSHLKLGRKIKTGGFDLWMGCMKGDKKAWKKMKGYNKQDVDLLEAVYLKLRPWDAGHPAVNVLDRRPDSCPKCGGTHINKGMKYKATNTNLYQYYRCMDCGGMLKARVPEYKQSEERMRYTR